MSKKMENQEKNTELRLPRLISDGMVLQYGSQTRIWGRCQENDSVTVTLTGREKNLLAQGGAVADEAGAWEVFLDLSCAGSGYCLTVETGTGESVQVTDVAVGEVWICSGQSNMELMMQRVRDRFPEEEELCRDPDLRIFKIREHYEFGGPLEDHLSGEWKKSAQDTIWDFSALTYFYGKFLRRARKVPVGLINASLGGSPIEAWMGREVFEGEEDVLAEIDRYASEGFIEEKLKRDEEASQNWYSRISKTDVGLKEGWFGEEKGTMPWQEIELPGMFGDRGLEDFIGVIWLRRKFTVPDTMLGKTAKIWLGTLVDSDETYVNGVLVGSTGYQYPPRKYEIPEGLLKDGENTVVVRLTCNDGHGRVTPDKVYRIFTGEDCVELEGKWEYRIGTCVQAPAPAADFVSWKPTGLYNGMLAPCHNYTVKGCVWYQGESNDKAPQMYEKRLKQLIRYWRNKWKLENLPFLIAQLPNFTIDLPDNESWPLLREAQRRAGMLPGVVTTVNIDLGEYNDLHPLNKKGVAYRLSLAARGLAYEEEVTWQGPVVSECRAEKDQIVLTFSNAEEGLITQDLEQPGEFEAAGEDGRYIPVEARIEGKKVILKTGQLQNPCSVRYAWRNNPDKGLLYNRAGLCASPFQVPVANMNKKLFNDGWEFSRQKLDTTLEEMKAEESSFRPVGLPHDWLIYDAKALYEDGTGWYRKRFELHREDGEIVSLCFDGVYMDSTVYVNGQKAGEWKYGYSSFEIDMTSFLVDGVNEVMVSVRHQAPNSRWYSGAGIYRDVWIRRVHQSHIPLNGVYVTAVRKKEEEWELTVDTQVVCRKRLQLAHTLYDKNGDVCWESLRELPACEDDKIYTDAALIRNPFVWDVETPRLYLLETRLIENGRVLQTEYSRFGFRTISFEPESGFYLNGRHLKLNGVCEHHDLGCLGAAYNRTAMRRKFEIIRAMGANAVRLTHNMPASDLMDLADEMGILIISEAFDMWESSKTKYDYGRFFSEWYQKDVASWIRRDRNHPCLIMWSIGNEIFDTHAGERGQELTRMLVAEVQKHDPKKHAPVTIGSNYMPWENARKCADIVKLAGYNYAEKYYEEHHREHPDWVIYGSETSSTVQSRGVYHFPYRQSVLSDDDLQCSALGNSTTSWGARSSEACIIAERDCSFSCGQFLWSGFDYIGEPTPYHTKNSYFGQIDTAGFPKDSYYIYQAEWTDVNKAPMVHLFPYWDFNEGQMIDVRACTNAAAAELFVNGQSQGVYRIDHKAGTQLTGNWTVPYHAGEIRAVAYDGDGNVVAQQSRHSFGEAVKICLKPDKEEILTDGRDLIFVEISMEDQDGYPVENANNRVKVCVSGAGRLVGLDNGDSTDYDDYKGISRRLFGGRLLAVVAAGKEAGEIAFQVTSEGMETETLTFHALACEAEEGISFDAWSLTDAQLNADVNKEILVRKIELVSDVGTLLNKAQNTAVVTARLLPEGAADDGLTFAAVNDAGITSNLAVLEADGSRVKVTAIGDGSFRLRCMSKCGTDHAEIISQLDFTASGLGEAYLNPYEFVSGGLYQYSKGVVTNGNEKGVATARDGETRVGYRKLDFGSFGSDEITVPIFALTSEPYPIQIWEGVPGEEGSSLLADVVYQKPSVWNVYQEETWRLNKRLKGITGICFVLNQKIHIKGFSFTRKNKAFERLCANECEHVYGDSFLVSPDGIDDIGNNVTVEFGKMDFGSEGICGITICGRTLLAQNAVHVRFQSDAGETKQLVEFPCTQKPAARTFELERMTGVQTVTFIFLPGSQFDFKWFRFER